MSAPRKSVGIRVNLTLPPEIVAVLDRMGKHTKAGRASIIREFMIDAAPQLDQMAKALEFAAANRLDAFKLLSDTLDQTISNASQLSLDIKRTTRRMRRKSK